MVTIELFTLVHANAARCFDLCRLIEVHLLSTEQTGERAVAGVTSGLIGMGEYVRWQATHLGVKQHLASKITAFDRPAYFQDTMIEGAFASMKHDHFFRQLLDGSTEMRDIFQFAAPLWVFGRVAERLILDQYMTRLLRHRNAVLKHVAESDRWPELSGT